MRISHFPGQEILEYQGTMKILPFEKSIRNNFLFYMIFIVVICIYIKIILCLLLRSIILKK